MNIDIIKLNYRFKTKPLLVGGMAMEYYKLRKSGPDIDLIITAEDYRELSLLYPENLKDLFGDLGVCIGEFEIWKSIRLFHYDFLVQDALELDEYKIISLEKLLFMKTLAMSKEKYFKDVELLVQKIMDIQYGKDLEYAADYFVK